MPKTSTSISLLGYWYSALREPLGLRLRASGCTREQLRAALYRSRVDAADTSLESLSIIFPPTELDEIWLIKREAPNGT